ncbi:phosphotransferase family protein [Primorskyibacter sp. S187A]|uniref:phosphotransferase family protein n=1 Tax=Primorskyibacter sp. S187A TaxID=3415130 RepID=UPI003C7973F0
MQDEDLVRVAAWCERHVSGFQGSLRARQFSTGQSNPTYLLEAGSGRYVLRRKPDGVLLKSAHAVDREYRVMRALAGSDVPVPRVHGLCEDDTVLDTMFFVMDHVSGRVHMDPSLPDQSAPDRRAILLEMARVLAAIHQVDPGAVGLHDFGPPGDYYARQLARWSKQYRASETGQIVDMDALIAWLDAHLPADDGARVLVHGDYRIDNLLFEDTRCTAVLDWELSTLGHPYADLAGVLMQWRLPPGDLGRGLAGIDRASLGLLDDEAFVAAYAEARGIAPPADLRFYIAFAFFRMGAILQGVKKRALDGNAANPEKARQLGAFVPEFARLGLEAAHG